MKAFNFTFLVILFFYSGTYAQKQGLAAIDSMKQGLAGHHKQDTLKVKLIYRITDAYVQINPDSAFAYAKTGMELSQKLNWKRGIGSFYNEFGMLCSDNNKYDEALHNYEQAYKYLSQVNNKRSLASVVNNMGTLYNRKSDYVKAQEYHFRALKLAEEIKDYKLIATFTSNIANGYAAQKDFKKAISFLLRVLKDHEALKNQEGVAEVCDKIGCDYLELHDIKNTTIYFKKALDASRYTGNKLSEAKVLSHIGLLYDDDLDKRMDYLMQAQRIFDETEPQYILSIVNIFNIGDQYADIGLHLVKFDRTKKHRFIPNDDATLLKMGEEYLKKVAALSKASGDKDNLASATEKLAQIQQKAGNFKDALSNFQTAKSINDSLYSQESKNKIAELSAQYAFQKKEDGYKQQQQISDLKMRQFILYAVLVIVLISGVLIFLLNRSRISQLRLKNELQKREAEEKTKELLHRNKLSESKLRAIRAQMNPHFIFNVLNSIESYILENDPKMACRLVQKFALLSRIILENSTQSLVVAETEWKALQLYTELEAIRFSNQFTFTFDADPSIDLSALLLPPMLIQPLIENSIHHGLRISTATDKAVSIKLEQTENHLMFTVDDNGVGIDVNAKPKTSAIKGKSIGLSAIRERIDLLNSMDDRAGDEAAMFEISAKTQGGITGTIARIKLPKIFKRNERQ